MVVIATSLQRYLERYRLPYRKHCLLPNVDLGRSVDLLGIPKGQVLRCELFSDGINTFQFITSIDKAISTSVLERMVGKALTKLSAKQTSKIFFDCEFGAMPPLGERYGLRCLIDREILLAERVFFFSGCLSSLVELSQCAFKALFEQPLYVSEPKSNWPETVFVGAQVRSGDEGAAKGVALLAANALNSYDVPALPPLAEGLLCYIRRGVMCGAGLIEVVKSAPFLEAKLIQYANSSFHHYPKRVETLEQAVNDVLGVELSSYLALAMASSEALKTPLSGPLGGQAFWHHSFLNAVLSQSIARHLPKAEGVLPSACYLAGLFHNFGLMLIAHLFPPEFKLLERLKTSCPKQALITTEKKVVGMGAAQEVIAMGHSGLGGGLLNFWQFPEVVQYVATYHHAGCYVGDYEKYVHLIRMSNLLLAGEGIGDECVVGDMDYSLNLLRMDRVSVERIFKQVLSSKEKIEGLSQCVTAKRH